MRIRWVFVTPAPGQPRFSQDLASALLDPAAPTHVWLSSDPPGFVMRADEYHRWVKSFGLNRAVSSSRARASPLACCLALNAALELTRCEVVGIKERPAASAGRIARRLRARMDTVA